MAQPFTATWRVTVPYTVTGVPHKLRFFVKSTGAVVSGVFQIINRDAVAGNWSDVVQTLCDEVLSWAYKFSETSMGTAVLEHLVGGLWLPVDTYSPTLTNHAVGAPEYASQNTLVLRDTAFNQIKVEYLEASAPIPYHSPTPPASGIPQSLSAAFLSEVSADSMYMWLVSRSEHYVKAAGAFVGITGTLNRKLRRRRGYA